jgi:small-conductance mechanosensitive channel
VGYDSDPVQVQRILCDAALAVPRALKDPAPVAHLVRLGADGLEFTLWLWVDDPSHQGPVKSEVNLGVLRNLRDAGIDIPFPQRVVHVRGVRHEISPAQTGS